MKVNIFEEIRLVGYMDIDIVCFEFLTFNTVKLNRLRN